VMHIAAGSTGLSVLLFDSFSSLAVQKSISESLGLPRSHFVALVCTSSIFFKLHSGNAYSSGANGTPVVLRRSNVSHHRFFGSLLHFQAGALVTPADAPQINLSSVGLFPSIDHMLRH
jgi:hypothetical protein